MESYPFAASHPDTSDSTRPCRDPPDAEVPAASTAWDDAPSSAGVAVGRVKLMISYGGRIQPRAHDNQLSYVGGDTKILSFDRAARFPAVNARLAALVGTASSGGVCLKYQLPGEDLDALVSVTNDEDLEHMMLEYDHLHLLSSAATKHRLPKPNARLRLFLFTIVPPPPPTSAALLDTVAAAAKPDPRWFLDELNFIHVPPSAAPTPTPIESQERDSQSPDFHFGIKRDFVLPPAVKVRDQAPELPVVLQDNLPVDAPAKDGVVREELQQRQQMQVQKLQAAKNQQLQQAPPPPATKQNGSEENLAARVHSPPQPEHHLPPQLKETATPPAVAAYWPPEQRGLAVGAAGMFASVAASGDHAVFFIPTGAAATEVYSGATPAPAGQGYYTAVQSVVPSEVYRDAAAMYAVPPAPQKRPVYYTSAVPTYQTVTSTSLSPNNAVRDAAVKPYNRLS